MELITPGMLRRIEEASLNAWPPLRQILYDGWIVRFADGYTRRANSVNPVYAGVLPVAEKIDQCEQFYRARQLKPIFRLTPLAQPEDLDHLLDQAGYHYSAPTSVQLLNLAAVSPQVMASVRRWDSPAAEWVETFARLNGVAAANLPALRGILTNIAAKSCFSLLFHQDQPVACGLGVLETGYVGLFDIVTDPAFRGQGFGGRLITTIFDWARAHGAQTAYLQVMLENKPALKLYKKLGFQEVYRYWYRVKEA